MSFLIFANRAVCLDWSPALPAAAAASWVRIWAMNPPIFFLFPMPLVVVDEVWCDDAVSGMDEMLLLSVSLSKSVDFRDSSTVVTGDSVCSSESELILLLLLVPPSWADCCIVASSLHLLKYIFLTYMGYLSTLAMFSFWSLLFTLMKSRVR